MLHILITYWPALLSGLAVTLGIAGCAVCCGIVLGIPLGWFAKENPNTSLVSILDIGKWFLSSVPALMFILWFYYPLQAILNMDIGPFWSAAIALAFVNILMVGQIVYAARCNLPAGLYETMRLHPCNAWHRLTKVEGPYILKHALSAFINSQISILHATLLASFIGAEDLLKIGSQINSAVYRPIEIYTILALIFAVICLPLTYIAQRYHESRS
ncbi:MAG: ABC transporter permease subunit [Alphaproteobacteria bacterium]|nr:ABC transporter permease subunit [Alphaproteobacteria bacterium]